MKPVLFDVTPLIPEKLSGVGVYTFQLYKTLKALGVDITPIYRGSRFLKKNHIASHIGSSAKPFFGFSGTLSSKGTIVHGADFKLPTSSGKFKKVLTIHDMAIFHPKLLQPSFCSEGQAKLIHELDKLPDAIIVPTDYIKGEFLTRFPKFQDKVHVVYHGCDHLQDRLAGGQNYARQITEKPYFLYVGHLEKRKNVVSLIKAFNGFARETADVDLVIAGKDGYGAKNIHEMIAQSPYNNRIHQTGYVGDDVLKSLYQHCTAFVYPSFYEGFGMPVIEAMKQGVPVITSQIGATAEVAGGHAHMVNPTDPADLYRGLHEVYHDEKYRAKLIQAGLERAGEFSWMKTARATAAIYDELSK